MTGSGLPKRLLAILSAVSGFFLSVGFIQVKSIELDATSSYNRLRVLAVVLTALIAVGLGTVLYHLLVTRRKRIRALAVLKRIVSTEAVNEFLKLRSDEIANSVVLKTAHCRVRASGKAICLNLNFSWIMDGVNTSEQRLPWLGLALTGDRPVEFNQMNALCKTATPESEYAGPVVLVNDLPRLKQLKMPLGENGVDTGERFNAELTFDWLNLLNRKADYFFFRPSSFAHSIGALEFSLQIEDGIFSRAMLYVAHPSEGTISFMGAELCSPVEDGVVMFTAAFRKLTANNVYVVLFLSDGTGTDPS